MVLHLAVPAVTFSTVTEPEEDSDSREEQVAFSVREEPEVDLVTIFVVTVALVTFTLPELLCAVRLSHSTLSVCTLPEVALAEKSLHFISSALTLPELESRVISPVELRLFT